MLTGFQLTKKFPVFYVTRRFITTVTSARRLSLSWASSIQSIPTHPTSGRYILTLILLTWRKWRTPNNASKWQMGFNSAFKGLILSTHLCLGLLSGLFLSGFHTKTLYTSVLSPCTLHAQPISFFSDFITRTILGEQYGLLSSSLCSFLHSPVTSPLLGPNILLSTLFSNTLNLRFSSKWATKFHTHSKHRQNYCSVW